MAAFLKPAKDRNAASPETNANRLLWISTFWWGQQKSCHKKTILVILVTILVIESSPHLNRNDFDQVENDF